MTYVHDGVLTFSYVLLELAIKVLSQLIPLPTRMHGARLFGFIAQLLEDICRLWDLCGHVVQTQRLPLTKCAESGLLDHIGRRSDVKVHPEPSMKAHSNA